MSVIHPETVADILRECSDQYIMPRYNKLLDSEVLTKTGPSDLVTQADIDVEEHLSRVLPELLPGSVVVGEEGVSSGTVSLDLLSDTTRPVWIVDPVDGTFNFVHGRREFGVMLGLIIDGVTEYGWIYDVLGEEMSIGARGNGAFCEGVRLQVAAENDLGRMSGHINPKYFPPEYRDHINAKRTHFAYCKSIGCAAHEYLRIAKGEAHFSVYSRLKPWDHIPGALIVNEAGGNVVKWDGALYAPHEFHTGIIATAKADGWREILDVFMP